MPSRSLSSGGVGPQTAVVPLPPPRIATSDKERPEVARRSAAGVLMGETERLMAREQVAKSSLARSCDVGQLVRKGKAAREREKKEERREEKKEKKKKKRELKNSRKKSTPGDFSLSAPTQPPAGGQYPTLRAHLPPSLLLDSTVSFLDLSLNLSSHPRSPPHPRALSFSLPLLRSHLSFLLLTLSLPMYTLVLQPPVR